MSLQKVHVSPFTVMGFTARTTNKEELSGVSRIGELWQRLMTGGQGPVAGDDESIFSVYTNYESDENGAYDVILGKRATQEQLPGNELRKAVHIPGGDYVVFPAANATADGIKAAWQDVYRYFATATDFRRAYSADFEKHSAEGVQLFIAVQ